MKNNFILDKDGKKKVYAVIKELNAPIFLNEYDVRNVNYLTQESLDILYANKIITEDSQKAQDLIISGNTTSALKNTTDIITLDNKVSSLESILSVQDKGIYDPSIPYMTGDLVSSNRNAYISRKDSNLSPLTDNVSWLWLDDIDLSNYLTALQVEDLLDFKADVSTTVTLDTTQTITGAKTFTKGTIFDLTAGFNSDVYFKRLPQFNGVPIQLPTKPGELTPKIYIDGEFKKKQNKLIAGTNITIDETTNTISSSGGGTAGGDVYKAQANIFTALNTFNGNIQTPQIQFKEDLNLYHDNQTAGYVNFIQKYSTGYKNWTGLRYFRDENGTKVQIGEFIMDADNNINITANNGILKLSGNSISMNNKVVTNVATPTANDHAANKAYVDSKTPTIPTNLVTTDTNQTITGIKTFSNPAPIKMNAIGNTTSFIEFLKDNARIGYFGKASGNRTDIALVSLGKLALEGTSIVFNKKKLEGIANGVANTDAVNVGQFNTKNSAQDVSIKTNLDNIAILVEQNKAQINYLGTYNSATTYKLNDAVVDNDIWYISLKDANTSPLTDTTSWSKTSASVSVDLSLYSTTIETNNMLKPLEIRLVTSENKIDTINVALGVNSENITKNADDILTNATEIRANTAEVAKNRVDITKKADITTTMTVNTAQTITGAKTFNDHINMGNKKILFLADGTAVDHAVNLGQLDAVKVIAESKASKIDVLSGTKILADGVTVAGKPVYMYFNSFTAIGFNWIEQTMAVTGVYSVCVMRKKDDGAWLVVDSAAAENELAINGSNKLQLNVTAKTGYTAEVKISVGFF